MPWVTAEEFLGVSLSCQLGWVAVELFRSYASPANAVPADPAKVVFLGTSLNAFKLSVPVTNGEAWIAHNAVLPVSAERAGPLVPAATSITVGALPVAVWMAAARVGPTLASPPLLLPSSSTSTTGWLPRLTAVNDLVKNEA